MPQKQLDSLVRIGKLNAEAGARAEVEGLIRSGNARLEDAGNSTLGIDSRFDLAYKSAHALSLVDLDRELVAALVRVAREVSRRVRALIAT